MYAKPEFSGELMGDEEEKEYKEKGGGGNKNKQKSCPIKNVPAILKNSGPQP